MRFATLLTSQRGLGNVGSDYDFSTPIGRRLENLGLQISRHLRVDWQDRKRFRIIKLVQSL
jgi:hypothetical protein